MCVVFMSFFFYAMQSAKQPNSGFSFGQQAPPQQTGGFGQAVPAKGRGGGIFGGGKRVEQRPCIVVCCIVPRT
jgi:hypothetical protein